MSFLKETKKLCFQNKESFENLEKIPTILREEVFQYPCRFSIM